MKLKLISVLWLLPIVCLSQTQIGQDIDGEAEGDYSGWSVSLSADGTILANGAVSNDGNGINSGNVRVYSNQAGTWAQIGSDIYGEAAVDQFGNAVSLSADGSILAVGARFSADNGVDSGHVRIYQNQSGTWTQLGNDIDGEAADDQSGLSVSLSADGTTVAIGAIYNDGNGFASGHVRIYKNLSNVWSQVGQDIDGEAAEDESGWSVSLSNDGTILAISARFNDGNGFDSGSVRVYSNQAGTWTQIGSDIDGQAMNDYTGWSVSLSGDGTILAIGALLHDGNGLDSGNVRVFRNQSGTWNQIGNDINGEASGDQSGSSISLSDDGTILAIGARFNDGMNGLDSGQVRIYRNESDSWIQKGSDIDGEAPNDQFGFSVSLSDDGTILAVGARYNDGNGEDAGSVRVYDLNPILSTDEYILSQFNLFPNPAKNQFTIQLNEGLTLEKVTIYSGLGQFVNSTQEKIVNTSDLSSGLYYVEIITNKGKATKKLVIE
jgi:hypothetical protein